MGLMAFPTYGKAKYLGKKFWRKSSQVHDNYCCGVELDFSFQVPS